MDDAAIKAIIENVVRERLDRTVIESVCVEPDEDFNGDRVYRVTVIFEPKRGTLDAERTSSVARHLRHKLLELNENAFPFFRFVSTADAKALKAAAA